MLLSWLLAGELSACTIICSAALLAKYKNAVSVEQCCVKYASNASLLPPVFNQLAFVKDNDL